jgi:hypothetical protein
MQGEYNFVVAFIRRTSTVLDTVCVLTMIFLHVIEYSFLQCVLDTCCSKMIGLHIIEYSFLQCVLDTCCSELIGLHVIEYSLQ